MSDCPQYALRTNLEQFLTTLHSLLHRSDAAGTGDLFAAGRVVQLFDDSMFASPVRRLGSELLSSHTGESECETLGIPALFALQDPKAS